jgi:hypothetical protein
VYVEFAFPSPLLSFQNLADPEFPSTAKFQTSLFAGTKLAFFASLDSPPNTSLTLDLWYWG